MTDYTKCRKKTDANSAACLWICACDLLCKMPQIDTAISLRVCAVTPQTLNEVKQYLLRFYPADTLVSVMVLDGDEKGNGDGSGDKKEQAATVRLADLKCDLPCDIQICGEDGFDKGVYSFGDLMRIMRRLTAEGGCPWDIAQTHQSIRENMLEEAGEAVAAIDSGDTDNLIEELGDVMLQSVFHADIAKRNGGFDMTDVITALCRKLYTRHTHVFGAGKAGSAGEALESWKAAKAAEKAKKNEQNKK